MTSRASWLVKRFAMMVFSLFAILTLLFVLFRILPGDPTTMMISPGMDPAERQEIRAAYGFDDSLYVQYFRFMENFLIHGEMGTSFQHGEPVLPFVIERAINTLVITFTALVTALIVGPILGSIFAWNNGEKIDKYGTSLVISFWSIPVFWTGLIAIMIFSFHLNWLPASGMHSPGFTYDSMFEKFVNLNFLQHAILPLAVFFILSLAQPTLYMRNNMIENMESEFVELKKAEGLPDNKIRRHAARNSLLPILHFAGLAFGLTLGSAVILETVFSWPGLGLALWEAVLANDFPVAQAAFFLISVIVIVGNFIADIFSVFIDPRVAEKEAIEE